MNDEFQLSRELKVDEACARFEKAWRNGRRPAIEEFVAAVDESMRATLVRELILIEKEFLSEKQTPPNCAGYRERFPEQQQWIEELFDSPNTSLLSQNCSTAEDTDKSEKPDVSRRIGNYEIIEKIGQGGMGVVYKARQLSLDRVVALKMIRSEYAGAEEMRRFRSEALTVAQLKHPHIVQIYEIGESQAAAGGEPMPYLVLEFVEGRSLAEAIKSEPQPPKKAAATIGVLAKTMQAAHNEGSVHRDLKPANILVARDGSLKITDFGLAKHLGEDSAQTRSGAVVGTPSYMAPEQAGGDSAQVCPQSDVYALGAILYELLTGRPPFKAPTVMETLLQVRFEEPVSPKRLQPNCPRDLETICLKCLEKEPQKRYATMSHLAEDVDRFLQGRPILARRAGAFEHVIRWARRRPALAGLSVVLVLLVAVLVAGGVNYNVRLADALRQKTAYSNNLEATNKQLQLQLAVKDEDRGRNECNSGNIAAGLHYLARSLATAPKDATAFRRAVLANLAAWKHDLHPLVDVLPHRGAVRVGLFSPDGATFFTGGEGKIGRLWRRAAHRPVSATMLHGHDILCAAFSADGKFIVTGSKDNTAKIWDAATGATIGRPLSHEGFVVAVAVSPDGKHVLTGSSDGTAQFWDPAGNPIGTRLEHKKTVRCVAFSPCGKFALTAGQDGVGRLWNVKTRQPHGLPLKHQAPIFAAAFSPDGARLLTGSWDCTARFWNVATGEPAGEPIKHANFVWRVAYAPDGKTVATADLTGKAQIWDAVTGKALGKPLKHKSTIWDMAYTADGKRILTGSEDGTAQFWDVATALPVGERLRHDGGVSSVALAPCGKLALTTGLDNTARLWKLDSQGLAGPVLRHRSAVYGIAFSHDGKWAATCSRDKTAAIWETATGEKMHVLPHAETVWIAAFSSDGKHLITGADDGAYLWDTSAGKQTGPALRHKGAVKCVAFHPNGRIVATGSYDRTARLWRVNDNAPIAPPMKHNSPICTIAFSPDGKYLATGCLNPEFRAHLWDVATGARHRLPFKHEYGISALAFSPDGRFLLVAGADGTACLWNVRMKKLRHVFKCRSPLTAVAFSPDGEMVALGTANGAARIREVATGKLVNSHAKHQRQLSNVAFLTDGNRLLATDIGGTARLWDVSTGISIGPPMQHRRMIRKAIVSPDGSRIFTCSDDSTARLWHVPSALPDDAGQIESWLQIATGMELSNRNEMVYLDAKTWLARRNSHRLRYPNSYGKDHLLSLAPIATGDSTEK